MMTDSIRAHSVLDAALTSAVRARLAQMGVSTIALVDLAPSGVSVLVGAVRGIPTRGPAAHGPPVHGSGAVPADEVVGTAPPMVGLTPRALDHALADHLIAVGRVARLESDAWFAELRKLVGRGRTRLATSEGAFIMGEEHVRLFRITRRDVEVATAPLVARLSEYVDDVLARTGAPDATVVLSASHVQWPALPVQLAKYRAAPVLVLDDVIADSAPTHGVSAVSTEDFPSADAVPSRHVRVVEPSRLPLRRPGPRPVLPVGFDDAVTDEIAGITDRLKPVASPRGDRPDPDYQRADQPDPDDQRDVAGLPDEPDIFDSDNADSDNADSDNADGYLDGYFDDSDSDPDVREGRWYSRQPWLLGGAVAGVLAVFGVAMAIAFNTGSSEPVKPSAAPVPQQAASSPTSVTPPEYADPSDLVEARRPAVRYTTPPPPPETPSQTETQTQNPSSRRPSRPQPPRVTIPIPGLPPIVLP